MKFCRLILLLGLVGSVFCVQGCRKKGFAAIENSEQIISEELLGELKAKGAEFKDSAWPENIEWEKVQPADIPDEVLDEAIGWVRTMIKAKWLSPDLVPKWIVGIHKEEYPRADYLIFRYKVAGHRIQVQESGGSVRVLLETGKPVVAGENIEDYVKRTIYDSLNYPEDKKDAFAFNMKSFEHNGTVVYYGTVNCDFDIRDKEARKKRAWWNHTFFWTDGKRTYFSLVEMDGTPPSGGSPTPGHHPRFGIEWKGAEEVEYKVRQRQR